ncbi:hypothetical protein PHAVU_007G147700 [Phaseolus vulgaris]|uniref:SWIM-type domain-containing protein n=1 Tax=Phaseolus vulgaris TaxID=3885 RepID=V7BIK1_PHAVU|nr:hypothetical protein PHAVU_007G147700g [Phaseolus vulgaris]ESW16331.1 hypothetical protein PHAVU_007G147700g [Phaseolus vulgaris]
MQTKTLEDANKDKTHSVLTFDRRNTGFIVEEIEHSIEIQPIGRFLVRLDQLWCECSKFQKLHLICSHVLVACNHAHHDFDMCIAPVYTLEHVSHGYEGLFVELRNERV